MSEKKPSWTTEGEADRSPDEDTAHLLIPAAWFVTELDSATEAALSEIVRTATE